MELMFDNLICYKTIGETQLKLHIFNPPSHSAADRRSAIVFFFGGGWVGGTPEQFYPHCRHLADLGMVAIAAEYRVENTHQASPRECVKDGKSAIRWVRRHAVELGVNPQMLAAGGGSAGAHVAAAAAVTEGFEEEGDDRAVSCRPNALVLFNPVFDNGPGGYGHERVKEYWQAFSPLHNIDSDTPPSVVFLGTRDRHVPVETAKKYKQTMENNGCRCDLHLYEGQAHGFFNFANTDNYNRTVAEMDSFLNELGYLSCDGTDFFTPEKDRLGLRIPAVMREDLPNVLLLGDSISIGYTEPVIKLLRNVCNVRRAPDNCGDTKRGLRDLEAWLGDEKWDLIHFNWGLHDLCHRHPDSQVYGNRDKQKGQISVPPEQYRQNLEILVKRLEKSAPKLIFANTTVVPPGEAGRFEGDEVCYNRIAAEIMDAHRIPVNDLYTLTAGFSPELFSNPSDVHFSEQGYKIIARQVADSIHKLRIGTRK
ncbi:MAG: alpha/beta hydrolase fold domain-containing protein [Lentisphaeria bacterium]